MERRKVLKFLAKSLPWLVSAKAIATTLPSRRPQQTELTSILETYIAGLPYYQCNDVVEELEGLPVVSLRREATNQHDENAIEVFYQNTKLGYIPKVNNVALAKLLDDKREFTACITSIDKTSFYREINIAVYLKEG